MTVTAISIIESRVGAFLATHAGHTCEETAGRLANMLASIPHQILQQAIHEWLQRDSDIRLADAPGRNKRFDGLTAAYRAALELAFPGDQERQYDEIDTLHTAQAINLAEPKLRPTDLKDTSPMHAWRRANPDRSEQELASAAEAPRLDQEGVGIPIGDERGLALSGSSDRQVGK